MRKVSIEVSEEMARWIANAPIFRMPGSTELRDAARAALERHAKPPSDETVCDILALALRFRPKEREVAEWDSEARQRAIDWAGSVHVAASDNVVDVPPEPPEVVELRATRSEPHAFVPTSDDPGGVWDRGCERCGRPGGGPVHQVESAHG